jgi:osmoprotectant transport system substrate-binding protein
VIARVATCVALAVLSGCTADNITTPAPTSSDALTWAEDRELSDLTVAVGAKSTPEQEVLGWLAVEALEANGAEVIPQIELGTTLEVRDALLGGFIDLYWEYTGTGWVDLLREIGPSADAETLAEAVAETDLDENAVAWLAPAPANSSFAVARGQAIDDSIVADSISDLGDLLVDDDAGVVLCVPDGGRFRTDPNGLAGLGAAVDDPIDAARIVPVPGADLVAQTEAGVFCPYGQILRTSPQLVGVDLELLDDDVGAFLIRNPAVTVRAEVLAASPEIADVLEPVTALLTDEELRELNASVAEEPAGARSVARAWLVDQGLADF